MNPAIASSRLGLRGASNLLSAPTARTTAMRRIAAPSLTAHNQRRYVSKDKGAGGFAEPPPSPTVSRTEASTSSMAVQNVQSILPGTFVRPPLSQFPREPSRFLSFLYEAVLYWGRGKLNSWILPLSSKPSILKAARYKLNNAGTALTAKAMHRQLAEALAAGDRSTIRRLCVKRTAIPMLASIDKRPGNRAYGWELVKYTGGRRYPRIVSQTVTRTGEHPDSPMLRQVVVAISSLQRRVEYELRNGKWCMLPETQKEVDAVENVVLVSLINTGRWVSSEWRIIGNVQPTTPEEWAEEKAAVGLLEKEELTKYKL